MALPNADGTASITEHASASQQKFSVVIPDGLYDVDGLQKAINIRMNAVSDPRARGNYYMRPSGVEIPIYRGDHSRGEVRKLGSKSRHTIS